MCRIDKGLQKEMEHGMPDVPLKWFRIKKKGNCATKAACLPIDCDIETGQSIVSAHTGDWVVECSHGSRVVMDEEKFYSTYELV